MKSHCSFFLPRLTLRRRLSARSPEDSRTANFNARWLATLVAVFAAVSINSTSRAAEWTRLLEKDLSQWDTYLSYNHSADYNGEVPVDANGMPVEPVGYGKNTADVFSVHEENGEPVLRVSGEYYGCLFTKKEFANYHLKLKVKWGTLKWAARRGKLRDSGILYHSVGPAGADYWRAWMLSQEFQLMEGHMGDYWNIAGSAIDIRAYLPEGTMNAVAAETQPFLAFGAKPSLGGFCLRSENFESKPGEWTQLELVCFEDKSLHIVNGHVVMVLKNSRMMKDGSAIPLTRGKIQLQSEGSEVFFRDIELAPLKTLPQEYEPLFK